jgi:hypothetical protein
MMDRWSWLALATFLVSATAMASADVLVFRTGERVEGQVVALRDGVVEFEARGRGVFGGRERLRVDREDLLRIEFDEGRRGSSFDDRGDRGGRDMRDDRPVGRPSGLRERDVSVDAWMPFKDTGIDVRAGQTVYFSAAGRVRWGPNRQDGPAGERNSPRNDQRPMPSRSAAALIGKVGDGTDYFFIGDDEGPIRMRSSGRLYLGVNDDYLQDNTGSFRVTVYY